MIPEVGQTWIWNGLEELPVIVLILGPGNNGNGWQCLILEDQEDPHDSGNVATFMIPSSGWSRLT